MGAVRRRGYTERRRRVCHGSDECPRTCVGRTGTAGTDLPGGSEEGGRGARNTCKVYTRMARHIGIPDRVPDRVSSVSSEEPNLTNFEIVSDINKYL